MRLVDTSAWIEWLADSPLAEKIASEIPHQSDWLVPTIVQHELSKWTARNLDVESAGEVVAHSRHCVVVPMDTEIALEAAECALRHKLATADAIIYATAQHYAADLLTCDAHFRDLPGVIYLPKSIGTAQ